MGVVSAIRIHGKGTDKNTQITIQGEQRYGSGRFSNVYSASMTSPEQRMIAIKNAWVETPTPGLIYPEIEILSKLLHPNIVTLLYHFERKGDQNQVIHCLVLDFLPDDVTSLRKKGYRFDLLDAKLYSYQLFAAVAHVHSKNIVHLDIKPSNLLIDHLKGHLKLCDFGNAKQLTTGVRLNSAYQVTRYYRAPELLFGSLEPTTAIDVWSAACVLYDFVANRILLEGRSTEGQAAMIVDVLGYPSSDEIKSMKCSRPKFGRKTAKGVEKIVASEFPADALDLLKSILIYNPAVRLTAQKAMEHKFFDQLKKDPTPTRSNGVVINLFEDENSEDSGEKNE